MSQGSLVVPTSGTVSGLTMAQDMNTALDALATSNSGASAPANAGGGAEVGQLWLDQSGSQPVLRMYDGGVWQPIGTLNASDHQWEPPIGGGAASLASASTVDLGSIPQSFVTITGTTPVTSFGTSLPTGVAKIVKFAAAMVLTYNATSMMLPTGASILTSAGDTAVVVALGGGNFEVVAYQPAAGAIPPGFGGPYYGGAVPSGWLLCSGVAVSRTTYAALFAAIGTTYGVGDGSTTFNLPDERGRVSVGKDDMGGTAANRITTGGSGINGTTLGASGGAETHVLSSAEMPVHNHGVNETPHSHTYNYENAAGVAGGSGATVSAYNAVTATATTAVSTGITIQNTGGGGAHTNVQPLLVVNKIIKY